MPTHKQTQLFFMMTGTRNNCARYSVRYKGKKAFVCTSNVYPHSTAESAGVEWEGGESNVRFAKNLPQSLEGSTHLGVGSYQKNVATTMPTRRKSRKIIRKARRTASRGLYDHTTDHAIAETAL